MTSRKLRLMTLIDEFTRSPPSLWIRFTATERRFHNEVGVPIVRIGCREFKCIGDKPPQDHPHIYLKMGDASEIVCPYCSTLFRFDPSLGAHEADPADCAYGNRD